MDPIASAFAKLTGNAPTTDELAALYRVKDALGIHEDDPLWMILIALQHYETLYRTIPEAIDQATVRMSAQLDRVLGDVKLEHAPRAEDTDRIDSDSRVFGWMQLPPWLRDLLSDKRIFVGGIAAAVAIIVLIGAIIGRASVSVAPVIALDAANNLTTCFQGKGRVESRNGERICYPVTADGRVLGYRLPNN